MIQGPGALFTNKDELKQHIVITTWICHYIHVEQWDAIAHPSRKFSGGSAKPPLQLENGWV